jgi:hypothetical protein
MRHFYIIQILNRKLDEEIILFYEHLVEPIKLIGTIITLAARRFCRKRGVKCSNWSRACLIFSDLFKFDYRDRKKLVRSSTSILILIKPPYQP